jgi:hypothetical protein
VLFQRKRRKRSEVKSSASFQYAARLAAAHHVGSSFRTENTRLPVVHKGRWGLELNAES